MSGAVKSRIRLDRPCLGLDPELVERPLVDGPTPFSPGHTPPRQHCRRVRRAATGSPRPAERTPPPSWRQSGTSRSGLTLRGLGTFCRVKTSSTKRATFMPRALVAGPPTASLRPPSPKGGGKRVVSPFETETLPENAGHAAAGAPAEILCGRPPRLQAPSSSSRFLHSVFLSTDCTDSPRPRRGSRGPARASVEGRPAFWLDGKRFPHGRPWRSPRRGRSGAEEPRRGLTAAVGRARG